MKKEEHRKRRETGFTLMELVIASIILAIVVTGIAFFFLTIIKSSDQIDDKTKALEICRDGIEMLRTEDVVSMPDGWQGAEDVDGFTRNIQISTPYSEYPEAKMVVCRVTWSGIDGADSLSLSTIF